MKAFHTHGGVFSLLFTLCVVANVVLADEVRFDVFRGPPDRVAERIRKMHSLDEEVVTEGKAYAADIRRPHPALNTTYLFDQLIDHNNPELGTFKMQYFHNWMYYEPGGPIILYMGGEDDLTPQSVISSLDHTHSLAAEIAFREKGVVLALEHRFFGQSRPFPDLSEESLKYLTIQQSIDDLEYFAKHVVLPMPDGDKLQPDKAPWILFGGSYSGALVAWTMVNKPGVFWAGYSSSGVVQPLVDFWQYFEPQREHMPKACSEAVEKTVNHIDHVFALKNEAAIDEIKSLFGLKGLNNGDFAFWLRQSLYNWQKFHVSNDESGGILDFCEILLHKGPHSKPGAHDAYQAWARNTTAEFSKYCGGENKSCMALDNPRMHNSSPSVADQARADTRAWAWMYCSEMGWFHTGPPQHTQPHIVSSSLRPDTFQMSCHYMFPKTFTKTSLPKVDEVTKAYHGWDVKVKRVFFVNGRRDPWRDVTLSASHLNLTSTPDMPIELTEGYHCDDVWLGNARYEPTIATAQTKALASFKTWMQEWRDEHDSQNPNPDPEPEPSKPTPTPQVCSPDFDLYPASIHSGSKHLDTGDGLLDGARLTNTEESQKALFTIKKTGSSPAQYQYSLELHSQGASGLTVEAGANSVYLTKPNAGKPSQFFNIECKKGCIPASRIVKDSGMISSGCRIKSSSNKCLQFDNVQVTLAECAETSQQSFNIRKTVKDIPIPKPSNPNQHRIIADGDNTQWSNGNLKAAVGDTVTFEFPSSEFSAVQSSFQQPCSPLRSYIGFHFKSNTTSGSASKFSIEVKDTAPIWGYSGRGEDCKKGMVFAINAPEQGPETFQSFKALAKGEDVHNSKNTNILGAIFDDDNPEEKKKKILIAAIAGGVGGLLLIFLISYCCCCRGSSRGKYSKTKDREEPDEAFTWSVNVGENQDTTYSD